MGKGGELPKTLCQRTAVELLTANGWSVERGGKHVVKMVKVGERPITLPKHKGGDYSAGLRKAILSQAGLTGGAGKDEGNMRDG